MPATDDGRTAHHESGGRRAALVTGASRGVGFEIAASLAIDGYDLTIVARDEDRLAGARRRLLAAGTTVVAVAGNLRDEGDVNRVFSAHIAAFDRLDVLVNNAGVGLHQRLDEIDARKTALQLDVNITSALLLIRNATRWLRRAADSHGKALIVNIGSIYGRIAGPGVGVYAATKAALDSIARTAHAELSGLGIQTSTLAVGFTDTPGASWTGMDSADMVDPRDVAAAVRFLLATSPRCFVPEMTIVPRAEVA